ncbi:hypothetical protein ALP24_03100 [Pseudomonas syringae pv. aptata]|uniref:Uncharacterized protein n=1 Tax=Pseudomonas syringae pv. aptata TaxID=83167 RepID=A0A3M5WNR0_PSEAP|nr:hypothetical protein ALP24_03100 [Pseudomonas syringae pv. aptata]
MLKFLCMNGLGWAGRGRYRDIFTNCLCSSPTQARYQNRFANQWAALLEKLDQLPGWNVA